MAQNFKVSGDVLQLLNESGSTITSGSPIIVGKFVGIALGDIADDAVGSVAMEGVFELPKATGTAIAQGDVVTWDTATKKVTKDFAGNDPIIGIAYSTEVSGATTIQVCIDEQPLKSATVAAITTANGSDAATTQALANATKTTVNEILTALKNAGIMAS
jgi:predicted RecA/RadA family phage recombinase